jgi:hypothetical protein
MKIYIHSIYCISVQKPEFNDIENHEECVKYEDLKFLLNEPQYDELIPPVSQRRMSKPVKTTLYAALKCFSGKSDPSAIIVANGLGVVKPAEVFLEKMSVNNETGASPTAFMQSLHSSIAGQMCLELKFKGYATTYTQSGFCFPNALTDAWMLIQEGEEKDILIGATDELTDYYTRLLQKAGIAVIDSQFEHQKVRLGEASVCMRVSGSATNESLACILDVSLVYKPQFSEIITSNILNILSNNSLTANDIDFVYSGDTASDTDRILQYSIENLFEQSQIIKFKDFCGEFPTASAFAVWMAVRQMNHNVHAKKERKSLIVNLYQQNYLSIILMSN